MQLQSHLPSLIARWKLDQGNAVAPQDPKTAQKLFYEARDMAAASQNYAILCTANLRLGTMAKKFEEAEAHYRAGLAAAEHLGDLCLITRARLDLGFNRMNVNRFDEAIPFLDEALDTGQKCGDKSLLATVTGNLGACYLYLGDIDRAMAILTPAEKLFEQIGMQSYHQWILGLIGNAYLSQGDIAQALVFHRRAEILARAVHDDKGLGVALNNEAEASLNRDDLIAARRFNDEALIVKRRLNDPRSLVYSELNAADLEARDGKSHIAEPHFKEILRDAGKAGELSVVLGAHGGLASLYRATRRPKLAEAQYREAIGIIDGQWNKLSDEWKVTFLAPRLIRFFQDYVDFLIETGRAETALEMAESSRARVLSERLERHGDVPGSFRVAALQQAARAAHTVILSYWLTPQRSSVWVIGAGPLVRFDLPPAKAIEPLVQNYMNTILTGGDPLGHNDPVAAALYDAILAPVYKLIPPGANVIVVPDGALHQINFETLVVTGPRPHYWIEDAVIATAPSLRVLTGDMQNSPRAPKLLLMGNPVLVGNEFQPLPNVKNEITAVEQQFPPQSHTVLTGIDAVPERYTKAELSSYTTIHFATHATANQESPLNSAIILSHQGQSFKLYARDVANVPLRAELVTISACHSAGAKTYSGEGLMGFAWAFQLAGAQNVIASLWNVDDASSVEIMRHLYREITTGQSPAGALRGAKLALMHSGDPYNRPYFWGPQQVFTHRIERKPRRPPVALLSPFTRSLPAA